MHRSTKRGNASLGADPRPGFLAVALVVGALYLWWRTSTLGSGWFLILSGAVLALEAWSYVELLLLAVQTWRFPPPGRRGDAGVELEPVDIVIDAYRADHEELERTLEAARAVRSRGRIIVVDDARRFRQRRVTSDAGATYWIDPRLATDPGLAVHRATSAERYLWLTAGQTPLPDLVEVVSPRFERDDLAVCQLGVSVLNADDLAHLGRDRDDEALVNDVIGPALGRWGAAPWLGPASVIRRRAVDEVEGFAPGLTVERLTARLHRSGWATDFERRKLVASTVPESLERYLVNRRNRAAAALAVLVSADGPLAPSGMRPAQRLAHVATAVRHTTGPRLLALTLCAIAVLITGTFPVEAPVSTLIPLWAGASVAQALARRALSRGVLGLGDPLRHGWRTIGAEVTALCDVILRRPPSTRPDELDTTPKRASSGLRAVAALPLLDGLVVAIDAAVLLRAATLVDRDLLPPFPVGQRVVVIGFALGLLAPMAQVLQVVFLRRQRRSHYRIHAALDATVDGSPATTVDVTPTGAGVLLAEAPEVGTESALELALPGSDGVTRRIVGRAVARSVRPEATGGWRVGYELTQLAAPARQALASFCATAPEADVVADEGGTIELIDPIARATHRRRQGLRRVSFAAGVAGLATMVFGPGIAAAETADPALVDRVCMADPAGDPVPGVGVDRLVGEEPAPLGVTDGTGCLTVALDPATTGFAVSVADDRYVAEPADYAGSTLRIDLVTWELIVLDLDGQPAAGIGVRFHAGGWEAATTPTAADQGYRFEGLPVGSTSARAVEIRLDGARLVRQLEPTATSSVLVLSRVRLETDADPEATADVAVDRGSGWEPVTDGQDILPGPTVVRLADGRVLRLEVPESHELLLPAGELRAVEVERPSATTVPEPGTTTIAPDVTTPTTTTTAETTPTTTVDDTATSTTADPVSSTTAGTTPATATADAATSSTAAGNPTTASGSSTPSTTSATTATTAPSSTEPAGPSRRPDR